MTVQELKLELDKYHPNLPVWAVYVGGQFIIEKVEQDNNCILLLDKKETNDSSRIDR